MDCGDAACQAVFREVLDRLSRMHELPRRAVVGEGAFPAPHSARALRATAGCSPEAQEHRALALFFRSFKRAYVRSDDRKMHLPPECVPGTGFGTSSPGALQHIPVHPELVRVG